VAERDEYGHEYQRWGVCRRCGCDHGDLRATEPCPGELPDLQTQPMPTVRPPVLPNGPSRRRRRIEDLALVDYVLTVIGAVGDDVAQAAAEAFGDDPIRACGVLIDAFQRGVEPADVDFEPPYDHNPNCGGTCGDRCNG
jgi:hypothetical protein